MIDLAFEGANALDKPFAVELLDCRGGGFGLRRMRMESTRTSGFCLGFLMTTVAFDFSLGFGSGSNSIRRFLSLALSLVLQTGGVIELQCRYAVPPQAFFLRYGRLQNIGHEPGHTGRIVFSNLLQKGGILRKGHFFLLPRALRLSTVLSFRRTLDGGDIS